MGFQISIPKAPWRMLQKHSLVDLLRDVIIPINASRAVFNLHDMQAFVIGNCL
jgi:hypothetical protein